MLSDKQEREILEKVRRVVDIFSKSSVSIEEIAEMTGIPASTVQRYLNSDKVAKMFGDEKAISIKNQLKENLRMAKIRGGENSARNNIALRDEEGKFKGSSRR